MKDHTSVLQQLGISLHYINIKKDSPPDKQFYVLRLYESLFGKCRSPTMIPPLQVSLTPANTNLYWRKTAELRKRDDYKSFKMSGEIFLEIDKEIIRNLDHKNSSCAEE